MAPACLFIWKESRGKGSHSLSNLKPRVNPCFCLPEQGTGSQTYVFTKSMLCVGQLSFACIYLFQGQPEAKSVRSRACSADKCLLLYHRREKREEGKRDRDHIFEVVELLRNLPLPSVLLADCHPAFAE